MADNAPYNKNCTKCQAPIIMRKTPDGWRPFNQDNTPHSSTCGKTASQQKEDSRIGIYGGVDRGRIRLTLRNGIMMTEATEDLLRCLNDPNTAAKSGMKVKLTFGKDGKAMKLEPCPDQPAPQQQAPHEEPSAHLAPHQDTRTSPESETPDQPERIDRDMLIAMVNNPDTYWRAKTLMDLEAHESICRQTERKNWQGCIGLAMQFHGVTDTPLDAVNLGDPSILKTAREIYNFIEEQVAGGA